jgi:DNA modification methylase
MTVRILIGDCLTRMKELPDNSVDSVVCDPPYHLTTAVKATKDLTKVNAPQFRRAAKGFMGQTWDGGDVAFRPETWAEVLRVLKPGGHMVAFSGTRTYHRMAAAIEDAGFEIRDMIAWHYGSGFPKSHDISKAIDRAAGVKREVVGFGDRPSGLHRGKIADYSPKNDDDFAPPITAPATDAARQWQGYGTALKPATEPICLARKPLSEKSIAANVLKWGAGALNIDGCRIEHGGERLSGGGEQVDHEGWGKSLCGRTDSAKAETLGRWPANLCHDGSDEVVAGFPETTSGEKAAHHVRTTSKTKNAFGERVAPQGEVFAGDSGSAARFFYCAKAASDERGEGNLHPTVKPVALMRWLCRLVTPRGGTVLDPFMGSGSTLIAADAEQFNAIGCELSPEYAAIAERRLREAAGMFADVKVAA